MEIEKRSQEIIAKKMWNIVRLVFYMMRKSITKKSKLMVDLQMLLNKGKIASKAISNLILHHHQNYYSTLTCRSNDDTSFVTPREYEFSCSNTPTFFASRRKSTHHHFNSQYSYQPQELKAMQKVFNILNRYDVAQETVSPLFGPSPIGPSPIGPMMKMEKGLEVDKDAEEFINKFYNDLKNQKRIASLDSPSPYHMWAIK